MFVAVIVEPQLLQQVVLHVQPNYLPAAQLYIIKAQKEIIDYQSNRRQKAASAMLIGKNYLAGDWINSEMV